MSKLLEQGIEEKNKRKVIKALREEVGADPGEKTDRLAKALERVENSGLDIWDKHDGWAYEYNSDYWTKDYYGKIFIHLYDNFSKDRFEHLRVVGKLVFANDPLPYEENETIKTKKSDASKKKNDRFWTHILIGSILFGVLSIILLHIL